MSRILIAFPTALIKSRYSGRSDIVFLDQTGFYISDGTGPSRRSLPYSEVTIDNVFLKRYQFVLGRLNWWMPVWYRWVANADQYELLTREAAFFVLRAATAIERLGISTAIFHTGVSHHIDSSLIEIACGVAGIRQVYLYANSINGRLLPLQQDQSILDRRPLGASISTYRATDDIAEFVKNKIEGGRPAVNEDISFGQNHSRSVVDLALLRVRNAMGRQWRNLTRRQAVAFPIEGASELGFGDHLRLMSGQKRAMAYYMAHLEQNPRTFQPTSGMERSAPVIAAHFQPEATSFPEGGDYANHIDIVVRIRESGYGGEILYKEHPASFIYFSRIVGGTRVGMSRSVAYYKQLLELGCRFLSPDRHLSVIPRDASWYFPITITGTLALERSLAGLSTVVAGLPWYSGLPGTARLADVADLDGFSMSAHIQSEGIRNESISFVDSILSDKTLTNIAGIGTGVPCHDANSIKGFFQEMDCLIDALTATPSS